MLSTDSTGQVFNVVSRMVIGSGKNGQYVKFTKPWPNVPMVTVTPLSLITADLTKSNSVARVHCYASDITNKGFRIICYSSVDSTSFAFGINNISYSYSETVSRGAYTQTDLKQRGLFSLGFARWAPAHTYSFSFGVNPKTKKINVVMKLWAKTTYHHAVTIDFRDRNNSIVTLYANGTQIWTGNFDMYIEGDGETSQTISTGQISIPSTSSITGTFWCRPYFAHPGDGSDDFYVKFDVLSADGILDTGSAANYIDTEGEALFLAVDGSSNNFTVS
jgi:hypothetical protein